MTLWRRFGKIALGMIAVGAILLYVEMRVDPSNSISGIDTSRILKDSEILISLGDITEKFVSKMASDALCTDSCQEKRDRFESAISQDRFVTHATQSASPAPNSLGSDVPRHQSPEAVFLSLTLQGPFKRPFSSAYALRKHLLRCLRPPSRRSSALCTKRHASESASSASV